MRRRRMRRMMFFGMGMGMFWGVPGFRRRQRVMNFGCSVLVMGFVALIVGVSIWAAGFIGPGIAFTAVGAVVFLLGIIMSIAMSRSLGRMRRDNAHLMPQEEVFDQNGNPVQANMNNNNQGQQMQQPRASNCPNCGAPNNGSSVCEFCNTTY